MSIITNYYNVFNATYLKLLSLCAKNLPIIFVAKTLNPPAPPIPKIVFTHSYKIALPVFFAPSVLVATYAKVSFKSSDPAPSCPNFDINFKIDA